MQTYKIKRVTNGKALECVKKYFCVNVIKYLKQNNEIIEPTFLEIFRNDFNLECLCVNSTSAYVYFHLPRRKSGYTSNGKRRIELDDSYFEDDLLALVEIDRLP